MEITDSVRYHGRKRSVWKRAAIGPIVATERTMTEARDRVLKYAEEALSGDYEPAMFAFGDGRIMVYRTPMGWGWRYWEILTAFAPEGHVTSCGSDDREAAIRRARLHLIQCAGNPQRSLDELRWLADDPEAVTDYAHWLGFQRAYAQWLRLHNLTRDQMTGEADTMAHRFACEHADDYPSYFSEAERAELARAQSAIMARRSGAAGQI